MKGRKMASLRLTSLILVVFFLLHALKNSIAHAHQAKVADSFEDAFAKKGVVAGKNHVAMAKKKGIGGRKMILGHEGDHEVMKNNRRAPMISGTEDRNSLKNSPKRSYNGSYKQMEAETKTAFVSHEQGSEAKKDELKRLIEAAKEIRKLMHRDYGERWRPRRKPPINNRTPKD